MNVKIATFEQILIHITFFFKTEKIAKRGQFQKKQKMTQKCNKN
jgi:hypothetical protein